MKSSLIVSVIALGIFATPFPIAKAELSFDPIKLDSPLHSLRIQDEIQKLAKPSIKKNFENPLVRVKLAETLHSFVVTGSNIKFAKVANSVFTAAVKSQVSQFQVSYLKKNGIGYWLINDDSQKKSFIIKTSKLHLRGQNLKINSIHAPNSLLVLGNEKKVEIIGIVQLEEYLQGVLIGEVPKSWPLEALKAQAVAARSYALAVMRERSHESYHLQSTVADQVYRDPASVKGFKNYFRLQRAVASTRGQFLADSLGLPVKTYFHADCGGSTIPAQNVWGEIRHGSGKTVAVDRNCAIAKTNEWNYSLSLSELEHLTQTRGVYSLDFREDDKLHRISEVQLKNREGQVLKSFTGNDFRSALGFNKIKSTKFTYFVEGEYIKFVGRGFGHGVGLCQWGAKKMADHGQKYTQILGHYYPNSIL